MRRHSEHEGKKDTAPHCFLDSCPIVTASSRATILDTANLIPKQQKLPPGNDGQHQLIKPIPAEPIFREINLKCNPDKVHQNRTRAGEEHSKKYRTRFIATPHRAYTK
jgi:hypothetical protein